MGRRRDPPPGGAPPKGRWQPNPGLHRVLERKGQAREPRRKHCDSGDFSFFFFFSFNSPKLHGVTK